MAEKTVKLYLFFTSLTKLGISFVLATYVVFLLSRGLNLFEVNLVNFVFVAVLFICEVPTGVIADIFGRKLSFVISCFLSSLGTIIYAFSNSLGSFILAEAILAVGIAFANGAFNAWLVDKLDYHNYTGSLTRIFSRSQQLSYLISIVGALVGSYLADLDSIFPWFVSGVVMLVAGILAWFFIKEEYFVKQKFSWKEKLQSAKTMVSFSASYGLKNGAIKFVVILGLVQNFAIQAPNMQWQPFFSQFMLDKFSLGLMFAGMSIFLAIGAAISTHFLKLIKSEKLALALSQSIIAIGIILASWFIWFPLIVTVFMFHEIGRGLFMPLKDVYLNKHIPSKQRATLISFESMSRHVGAMVGLLVSGLLAQASSINTTWLVFGAVLLLSNFLVFRHIRK